MEEEDRRHHTLKNINLCQIKQATYFDICKQHILNYQNNTTSISVDQEL